MTTTCPCCHQPVESEDLIVSLDDNRVARGEVIVALSPMETVIAHTLFRRYPGTVTRENMFDACHGANPPDNDNSIKVHVSHLRKSLRLVGVGVQAVYGVGYRLNFDAA